MIEAFLVPEKTVATAKGDGPPVDVSAGSARVFLLTPATPHIIEQEALDVSVPGSADGTTFDAKPLVPFPQKFYRGEYPLLVDISATPEIKAIRGHWEFNRWDPVTETPMF